jgi:hypothetical protein
MEPLTGQRIEELLVAVGELLRAAGCSYTIVVVGGASLNLQGLVERTTKDVDVVARAEKKGKRIAFVRPDPLPAPLQNAIATVARDFGLPEDWMNTQVAGQWPRHLPEFLFEEIHWRDYAALRVGIVGRPTLIALKLHAAADRDAESVHYQDLLALSPSAAELRRARSVAISQDAGAEFPRLVDQVIARVQKDTGGNR